MIGYTLIVDTSIYGAAVGLLEEGSSSLKFLNISVDVADSARQLPLMVNQGLKQLGLEPSSISKLLVSKGPGSFTGIRVGLAYAFGFLAGLNISVASEVSIAGVSSLELIAKKVARDTNRDVIVFLPSTKTTGYWTSSKNGQFEMSSLDFTRVDTDSLFIQHKNDDWVIIGDWPLVYDWAAKNKVKSCKQLLGRDAAEISIKSMATAVSLDDQLCWVSLSSSDLPRAVYLRKSTVEEKAMADV